MISRPKYRIVRHENPTRSVATGEPMVIVNYTCQRRFMRFFWLDIKKTIDCSDRVPNCYGTVKETVLFKDEREAVDFITRFARRNMAARKAHHRVVARFDAVGRALR